MAGGFLQVTPRERQALQMLADGTGIGVIAARFACSEREIEQLLRTLFVNMGASSSTEAVATALRRGLLT